jgi:probable DNA metabolism protein
MNTYVYDGSFDGFLCVVAAAYGAGESPAAIVVEAPEQQGGLFGDVRVVETHGGLAARTRRALEARADAVGVGKLYRAFLSEQPGVERTLYRVIQSLIAKGAGAMEDLRDGDAFRVMRLAQQVGREVHRMHAFVRFEERADARYVATVAPDFNVLPLLGEHFAARYPAQRWAIVDVRRRYALVHDAEGTRFAPAEDAAATPEAEREAAFQRMWRGYFHAVSIPERANPRLHLQHVPRRYWPYLTEKRGG